MTRRIPADRSKTLALGLAALSVILPALVGCSQEQQTVTEIKRAFARRAIAGEVEIGSSGRLAAGDIDRTSLELLDVRFDIGGRDSDDLLMHAERAEIVVNTTDDTMLIRFHNVTAAATDGGLTEQPVVVTSAWPLRVDAIDD